MKAAQIVAAVLGAVPALPPTDGGYAPQAGTQMPYVPHQAQPPSTAAPVQYIPPQPQWAPPPPPQGQPASPAGGAPYCVHGPRTRFDDKNSRGPYTLWFCALPKGTVGSCPALDGNGKELKPR